MLRRPLAALLAAIFLYLWAATLHEFNWGVPQYRQVWHPLLLAFGGAQALVLARLLGGRFAAVGALAIWLPLQVGMTLLVGGPLEVTMPSTPLFIVEAAIVELLAGRGDPRRPLRFGVLSGLAVGSLGFAANYAWSQVAVPLPWEPTLLRRGRAGGAGRRRGRGPARRARWPRRSRAPWLPAGGRWRSPLRRRGVIALGVNAAITNAPAGVTATMALTDVRQGATPNNERPSRSPTSPCG